MAFRSSSADGSEVADSELQRLLQSVTTAIGERDLAGALRFADAARRRAPDAPSVLCLHSRLLLQTGEAGRALAVLERAGATGSDPNIEACAVEALLSLGRREDASRRLQSALHSFAIEPGDPLALAARRMVMESGGAAVGWFGLSAALEVWGEICGDGAGQDLEVQVQGQYSISASAMVEAIQPGLRRFRAVAPSSARGQILVLADGARLVGSDLPFPPDFGLDGRARLEAGWLSGWVRARWAKGAVRILQVEDSRGRQVLIEPESEPDPDDRYPFRMEIQSLGLAGPALTVLAILPGEQRLPLPDSPVLTRLPRSPAPGVFQALRARLARPAARAQTSGLVDVIIPAYRGCEETLQCIRSVLDTTQGQARVVVIDDASPEPDLSAELRVLAAANRIILLTNEANLGFPASVNRGLALHPDRDVIVLNADTQVFPGWLERIRAAANSDPRIGTVTPLTNAGSIVSYPDPDEGDCSAAEALELDQIAAVTNPGQTVDIPVGVGFCLLIKRACLDQTGLLDATAFAKGYGEEVDFCRRASGLGWRHVLAADVFVRHLGGRSFGTRRDALIDRSGRILNARHPGYDALIQDYLSDSPIKAVRRRLGEARMRGRAAPHVLIITHDLPGGIDRVVEGRADHFRALGLEVAVIRPDARRTGLSVSFPDDPLMADLTYDQADDRDEIIALVKDPVFKTVEVHQFIGMKSDLTEAILAEVPAYDVFIHDYVWICPRITLLNGEGRYCGEPAIRTCETCLKTNGGQLEAGLTVRALRRRSGRWLKQARSITAPSLDVARRLGGYFPALDIQVRPWEPPPVAQPRGPAAPKARTKVALIGAIGDHKGYEALLDCATDAIDRQLPLDFVVIGYTRDDRQLTDLGNVFITGRYEEDEVGDLLAREQPDVAFLASVWPETWCFALSHGLRSGAPIVAFDIGAIAERLRGSDALYSLLPLGTGAAEVNDALLKAPQSRESAAVLVGDPSFGGAPEFVTLHWQDNPATIVDDHPPTLEIGDASMPDSQGGLKASVDVLTLNKGIYQLSVKSGSPRRVGDDGELVLPAIHVGAGPGVSPDQFEMMTGLKTVGAWLYEPRDLLIIKIMASPTLMLITSVRTEGMAPLEIVAERLDGKKPSPPAPPRAMPALEAPIAPPPPPPAPLAPERRTDSQGRRVVRTKIVAHITNRGDMNFVDAFWAGSLGENLPIESLSIQPLEALLSDQIEYKALTATGVETDWVSGGANCGTRGLGVPLTGFAVRLKPDSAGQFECEYRGAFQSGKIIGPLSGGAPCRADAADDCLVGVQVTIVEKKRGLKLTAGAEMAPEGDRPGAPNGNGKKPGPRFSIFREEVQ